jgi:hypothetical protein
MTPGRPRGPTQRTPRLPPPTAAVNDDGNGAAVRGRVGVGGPAPAARWAFFPAFFPAVFPAFVQAFLQAFSTAIGTTAPTPSPRCLSPSPAGKPAAVEGAPPTLPRNGHFPLQALSLDTAVGRREPRGGSSTPSCRGMAEGPRRQTAWLPDRRGRGPGRPRDSVFLIHRGARGGALGPRPVGRFGGGRLPGRGGDVRRGGARQGSRHPGPRGTVCIV